MTDEELAAADRRLSVPGVPERVGWPLTVTEQRALVAELRLWRAVYYGYDTDLIEKLNAEVLRLRAKYEADTYLIEWLTRRLMSLAKRLGLNVP